MKWLDNFQNGGKAPKYVESKNDPRYKAYQDSLFIHEVFKKDHENYDENIKPALSKSINHAILMYERTTDKNNIEKAWNTIDELRKINKKNVLSTYKQKDDNEKYFGIAEYKKPEQPILLKKKVFSKDIPKVKEINNELQPIGIQTSSNNIETNIPNLGNQFRVPKYYDVTDTVNKNIGGSESSYKWYPGNGEALQELAPEPLNSRKMVPHYNRGGVIKDNRGQWDHPGEITEIGSPHITMQGVGYPVLGISKQTGEKKLMLPEKNYKFANTKQVVEYPMVNNSWLDKFQ